MIKVNIDELAKEIHETAKEKGFWDDDRNLGEILMLIVSELSESLEEHRDGNPNLYLTYTGKPEGIAVELADAAIRILDTLYSRWDNVRHGFMRTYFKAEMKSQLNFGATRNQYSIGDNFGENLLRITSFVVRAESNYMWLVAALVYIDRLCVRIDADLWELARKKMDYNTTRAYKHGKAY